MICQSYFFCKPVKLCTYVHLVWACHGRGRLGEAVNWVWIDGNGDHKPAHAQEAEKESHARALHGQTPLTFSVFWVFWPRWRLQVGDLGMGE